MSLGQGRLSDWPSVSMTQVTEEQRPAPLAPAAVCWQIEERQLTLLRRPVVGLGAGAAHQHGALAIAQALGLDERLHRILVIDDGERARPVGAPQAALEP